MSTLFISDLHLAGERPATTGLFVEFLEKRAHDAEKLYILGDLFEAWLGDDLILPEYQQPLDALRQFSAAGVQVNVMHGNRDFLMGEQFEALTGTTLLSDPVIIDLHGRPALLTHGDTLCTDDTPYQELRAMVRNPEWIENFLQKRPDERISFARELRNRSREATARKDEGIMDVNQQAVENLFREYDVEWVIHGHTHRPAIHELLIDHKPRKRMVLGDWHQHGSVLHCDDSGCRLEQWPAQ